MFAMESPWLDSGAGTHQWLGDYYCGFLYGVLHYFPLVSLEKKKKKVCVYVIFIQTSLSLWILHWFPNNHVSHADFLYGFERLSATLYTATSSVSWSSQLCLDGYIIDLSMGDLISNLFIVEGFLKSYRNIVPLSFHHPLKIASVMVRPNFIEWYL